MTAQVLRDLTIWTRTADALLADPAHRQPVRADGARLAQARDGQGAGAAADDPRGRQARDHRGAWRRFPDPAGIHRGVSRQGHSGAALARACAARARARDRLWQEAAKPARSTPEPIDDTCPARRGTLPEYRGQDLSGRRSASRSRKARSRATSTQAKEIAARIGYPVALKAQAAALAHKSDAGGVALNIADAGALEAAWQRVAESVAARQPGLALDGMLVEAMAPRGVELIVGARRDPRLGTGPLVGLGGIWTEALDDVRLMPADTAARRHHRRDRPAQRRPPAATASAARQPVNVAAIADVVMSRRRADARASRDHRDRHQSAGRLSGRGAGAGCADRLDLMQLASAARFCWIGPHRRQEIRDGSVLRPDQMPSRQVLRGRERHRGRRDRLRGLFHRG